MKKDYKKIKEAMKHPNKLGAGAAKRRSLPSADKAAVVMKEFARHTLHSGSGEIVTNPQQAKAIAMSEAGKKRKK
jgi:hypothetical protein